MHISKYFLRHWAETLSCAWYIRLIPMGLWAATVALLLRGPITLHLHITPHPTPRRIYEEQCLGSSEARTGVGYDFCPLPLTTVQMQMSYSISTHSSHQFGEQKVHYYKSIKRHTLMLENLTCLKPFQISGNEAEKLIWLLCYQQEKYLQKSLRELPYTNVHPLSFPV